MAMPIIRFSQGALTTLRRVLLEDLSREHFGILLARHEVAPDGREIFVVQDAFIADDDDLIAASLAQVRPSKEFVTHVLAQAQQDMQSNAIIDVHTHPFAKHAYFSSVDDKDERTFSVWLGKTLPPDMAYASIVFSQDAYAARVWHGDLCEEAEIRAALPLENIPRYFPQPGHETPEMQARTALALGVDTLERITAEQLIVLAGVGGLGSVLAEQLVRSGFTRIGLIDSDSLDMTNLNRFVGGYQQDIGRLKVEVVRDHLQKINPDVQILEIPESVESADAQALMARADWIVVSTDTHSSRSSVQETAHRYGVSLVSVGVNITVENRDDEQTLVDQSGEVILLPHGCGMCLHCLGRIKPYVVAAESNADSDVRYGLVQKGYVRGMIEKQPAVLSLNSSLASIATQIIMNQYRQSARPMHPITVFECHDDFRCYADEHSLNALPTTCPACGRVVSEMVPAEQDDADSNNVPT